MSRRFCVMPAKAGIQAACGTANSAWTPAFAGVTVKRFAGVTVKRFAGVTVKR